MSAQGHGFSDGAALFACRLRRDGVEARMELHVAEGPVRDLLALTRLDRLAAPAPERAAGS